MIEPKPDGDLFTFDLRRGAIGVLPAQIAGEQALVRSPAGLDEISSADGRSLGMRRGGPR